MLLTCPSVKHQSKPLWMAVRSPLHRSSTANVMTSASAQQRRHPLRIAQPLRRLASRFAVPFTSKTNCSSDICSPSWIIWDTKFHRHETFAHLISTSHVPVAHPMPAPCLFLPGTLHHHECSQAGRRSVVSRQETTRVARASSICLKTMGCDISYPGTEQDNLEAQGVMNVAIEHEPQVVQLFHKRQCSSTTFWDTPTVISAANWSVKYISIDDTVVSKRSL